MLPITGFLNPESCEKAKNKENIFENTVKNKITKVSKIVITKTVLQRALCFLNIKQVNVNKSNKTPKSPSIDKILPDVDVYALIFG